MAHSNPYIDGILWGGNKLNDNTITYSFWSDASLDDDYYNEDTINTPWFDYEEAAMQQALTTWSNVANINFVQTADNDANANFGFLLVNNFEANYLGAFSPPGTFGEGIGYFNWQGTGWDAEGLQQGGFGFITLIHELGHGLGLAHPHDTGGGSSIYPGVSSPWDTGDYGLNQGVWTTMTYNDGLDTNDYTGITDYGYQGGPMAFDIAAIQYLYGANMSYKTGNDTYVLPTSNTSGTFYSSIWDAGGIDTISAATATADATINLNDAPLVGPNAGGYLSAVEGIYGGFTIANGVVIENAIGGAGDDTIIGNEADNDLSGGAGNDYLDGWTGNDNLYGGSGNDTLLGYSGNDYLDGGSGNDSLNGESGNDYLNGWTGDDNLYGSSGNDILLGSFGNDYLDGGSGNDNLYGESGNDYLDGWTGDDNLYGSSGNDTLLGSSGDDYLDGGSGNDNLYGEADNDFLDGWTGDDNLYGGSGNDTLLGSSGDDYLSGGSGNDNLYGEADNDFLDGWTGDDNLYGSSGNDTLLGYSGDDYLSGGSGNDNLYGEADNDFLDGWTGDDNLYGGSGNDTLLGYSGDDDLDGGSGNDNLYGESGNDTLLGGTGTDILVGGSGNDSLNAYGGNTGEYDILSGDYSSSQPGVTGASDGADTFVLGDTSGAFYLGLGYATVTDFYWAEGDMFQAYGSQSDYSLGFQNWSGSSATDTLVYYQSDLIAVVQDTTNVIVSWDFTFV